MQNELNMKLHELQPLKLTLVEMIFAKHIMYLVTCNIVSPKAQLSMASHNLQHMLLILFPFTKTSREVPTTHHRP